MCRNLAPCALGLLVVACGSVSLPVTSDGGATDAGRVADAGDLNDAGEMLPTDAGSEDAGPDNHWTDTCGDRRPNAFATSLATFMPGDGAGFGQEDVPCVVLGPPDGKGPQGGSLDVVSLGKNGSIVLKFDDVIAVDGPGPDLIVFENAFPGWLEPGFVAVSEDGQDWHEWACEATNADGGYPNCAGVKATLSNPMNGISPLDPSVSGGDVFDFADLGVTNIRYVRIRDSGDAHYGGVAGGFDLDAIAAVHSEPVPLP